MPKSREDNTFSFLLVLGPLEVPLSEIEDALFEAGCDDALLGIRNGAVYLDFDRSAPSLEDAVFSAIRQIESAPVGAKVRRVEPDDPVTAAEIARRVGKSREAVRLWIEGRRGKGNFPIPQTGLAGTTVLWSWVEVTRWLVETGAIQNPDAVSAAELVATLNRALEARDKPGLESQAARRRHRLPRLPTPSRRS